MANIFANQKDYVEKHKRNTFDLSFTNNLTFDFGQLVPVFCKEVIPGDSFRITPSFGLRLMPLVFPIQTRLNANLHFFYVRNRNLWKDWPDFIGRTKSDLVPPYLGVTNTIATGKLADYLGVPTTIVGDYGNYARSYNDEDLVDNITLDNDVLCLLPYQSSPASKPYSWCITADDKLLSLSTVLKLSQTISAAVTDDHLNANQGSRRIFLSPAFSLSELSLNSHAISFIQNYDVGINFNNIVVNVWCFRDGDWYPDFVLQSRRGSLPYHFDNNNFTAEGYGDDYLEYFFDVDSLSQLEFQKNDPIRFPNVIYSFAQFKEYLNSIGSDRIRVSIGSMYYNATEGEYFSGNLTGIESEAFSILTGFPGRITIRLTFDTAQGVQDVSHFGDLNPYTHGDIHISALPFRAYESIYNCFYRNQFNDPFILNGQKEYNKFISNNEGGSDNVSYKLFKRNYELDFLTSARQSPVDGDITPLVGVNAVGKFTFKNADDTTYTVTPIVGEDGHTLTGIESMEGTPENNSGLRRLVDMISLGISINDFRNVNALQRWLETNLRRGYRYKDQIMSHFGVEISYEELDMPEFIGGMSEPILVNQVNQSVDQTGNPDGLGDFSKVLGSYAGQASIMAQSKHSIKKYCDEHGFIIGILSVTPVPCYSQLLPKYLIKNNVLDYYFPEFGHIGNQPITYKEVCPIQVKAAGDSLDDVFGYQRPWYDYLASVDEVHGDFRMSLDGFLITRLFDTKPELGKKFIEVDKDSMTNPFSVTDDSNKILGQVYFDVTAQRPIPKYGVPRLE